MIELNREELSRIAGSSGVMHNNTERLATDAYYCTYDYEGLIWHATECAPNVGCWCGRIDSSGKPHSIYAGSCSEILGPYWHQAGQGFQCWESNTACAWEA